MKKINATYKILSPIDGVKELKHIEQIGRVCYKSEEKITDDGTSAAKFVDMLIKHGHEAMIEHSTLAIKFIVDRGVSHELVRHRIASFAQESTRYVNYSDNKFENECSFINLEKGIKLDTKMHFMTATEMETVLSIWEDACISAEQFYMQLIKAGATPQIARSVLPNSTKTEIIITANYREWRNFFKLRVPKTAHPQMREVTIPLLIDLQEKLPVIFGDIEVTNE